MLVAQRRESSGPRYAPVVSVSDARARRSPLSKSALALGLVHVLGLGSCDGDAPVEPAQVQYIEVAASDYKLELEPAFDAAVTSYVALADGPEIEVYIDVIVDRDVDGVTVNEVAAELNGFRTWRSAPATGLVSPTMAVVDIVDGSQSPAHYEIAITVP